MPFKLRLGKKSQQYNVSSRDSFAHLAGSGNNHNNYGTGPHPHAHNTTTFLPEHMSPGGINYLALDPGQIAITAAQNAAAVAYQQHYNSAVAASLYDRSLKLNQISDSLTVFRRPTAEEYNAQLSYQDYGSNSASVTHNSQPAISNQQQQQYQIQTSMCPYNTSEAIAFSTASQTIPRGEFGAKRHFVTQSVSYGDGSNIQQVGPGLVFGNPMRISDETRLPSHTEQPSDSHEEIDEENHYQNLAFAKQQLEGSAGQFVYSNRSSPMSTEVRYHPAYMTNRPEFTMASSMESDVHRQQSYHPAATSHIAHSVSVSNPLTHKMSSTYESNYPASSESCRSPASGYRATLLESQPHCFQAKSEAVGVQRLQPSYSSEAADFLGQTSGYQVVTHQQISTESQESMRHMTNNLNRDNESPAHYVLVPDTSSLSLEEKAQLLPAYHPPPPYDDFVRQKYGSNGSNLVSEGITNHTNPVMCRVGEVQKSASTTSIRVLQESNTVKQVRHDPQVHRESFPAHTTHSHGHYMNLRHAAIACSTPELNLLHNMNGFDGYANPFLLSHLVNTATNPNTSNDTQASSSQPTQQHNAISITINEHNTNHATHPQRLASFVQNSTPHHHHGVPHSFNSVPNLTTATSANNSRDLRKNRFQLTHSPLREMTSNEGNYACPNINANGQNDDGRAVGNEVPSQQDALYANSAAIKRATNVAIAAATFTGHGISEPNLLRITTTLPPRAFQVESSDSMARFVASNLNLTNSSKLEESDEDEIQDGTLYEPLNRESMLDGYDSSDDASSQRPNSQIFVGTPSNSSSQRNDSSAAEERQTSSNSEQHDRDQQENLHGAQQQEQAHKNGIFLGNLKAKINKFQGKFKP